MKKSQLETGQIHKTLLLSASENFQWLTSELQTYVVKHIIRKKYMNTYIDTCSMKVNASICFMTILLVPVPTTGFWTNAISVLKDWRKQPSPIITPKLFISQLQYKSFLRVRHFYTVFSHKSKCRFHNLWFGS